jgi:hypothetical protein
MIRKVRKKLASSISKIDQVDDFNFSAWLKKPSVNHQPIESIRSSQKDLSNYIQGLDPADNAEFEFSLSELPVSDEIKIHVFPKIRSSAIFFMMHSVADRGITIPTVEMIPLGYAARYVEFVMPVPSMKDIRVKFSLWSTVPYKCNLDYPEIFDYLSSIVPEVFKIELLRLDEFVDEKRKTEIKNVAIDSFNKIKINIPAYDDLEKPKKIYKVKIPAIGKYKTTLKKVSLSLFSEPTVSDSIGLNFAESKKRFLNFNLSGEDSILFYSSGDEKLAAKKVTKTAGLKNATDVQDHLKFILSNIKKIDWSERKDLHIPLKNFEEDAAKFLIKNEYALLQDEFGIDRVKEIIAALKFVLGNRMIKSVLIVSSLSKKGNLRLNENYHLDIGWLGKLKRYCPDFPLKVIEGSNDERVDHWNKPSVINFVDIQTVINDYHLKILEDTRLKRFDCIILDEVDSILMYKDRGKEFVSSLKPQFLWASTGVMESDLLSNFNSWLNPELNVEQIKVRTKGSVKNETGNFKWHEVWVDASEEQQKEFKSSMVECQKDLRRVLESGNPLRFTANIFTLLHRLNQTGNFSATGKQSPKADLLIEHISKIKANGKKVLILSQYDRFGTKKIEQILNENGVNNIVAAGSSSIDEMRKNISRFSASDDITAFVTDAKIPKLNFSAADVSYVIKFDSWWNPISGWEIEDIFASDGKQNNRNERIDIITYYLFNTLDQRIRELLDSKEMLNKNIYEFMNQKLFDELIEIDDWLRVFNMPYSDEQNHEKQYQAVEKQIRNSSVEVLRSSISKLFSVLGYSNLDVIEAPDTSYFKILGRAQRNKKNFNFEGRVYFKGEFDENSLKKTLDEVNISSNQKFIIVSKNNFPDVLDRSKHDNVAMIDVTSLSKLLFRLGIVRPQADEVI